MKKYYVSLLALGDNLISLSLLKQLNGKIDIIGTKHTSNIVKLMQLENKFNIVEIFDDIPAFYDIKKKGIIRAIVDFYKLIKYINTQNFNELIFEKKDFRTILISFLTNVKIITPNCRNINVYKKRKELIENVSHKKISFYNYKLKLCNPKKVVINPLTRVELKNIKDKHLEYIINILNKNNYEIYLIDIENKYNKFKSLVKYYLTDTTLEDVKQLISQSDLYIGGDSFLIHLAYYLQKNYFIIFYIDNDDFMPPNIEDDFYIKVHLVKDFEKTMKDKFQKIGLINLCK